MEGSVEGQVAIVTGAGQGIGRAIAQRLAEDGMQIVVADLQSAQAEQVASEISRSGRRAVPVAIDVTRADDRQRMMDAALNEFGRLDVLVNNAGIQRVALPLDVSEEHWDIVMNVNAKAVYFCCQLALRHMLSQHSGRIVNIASMAGKMASTPYHPVYNVSKAAVLALTKTFALTYASEGVRVNAVCPGIIGTPMQDVVDLEFARVTGKQPEEIRAERMGRVPMGRIGEGEDVAAVVSFLVGPDSRYMTGQALNVTGGMITY
ncbi:MAG TPA: glucose 1-dehydrogenase [Ktedonosporobacter sp.]|nr:glucose 1-dehydrogenase [Ktedonosporobacter sp.]